MPTQGPPPPLVWRAGGFTALAFFLLLLLLHALDLPSTPDSFLQRVAVYFVRRDIHIALGFMWGTVVIWLLFPRSYTPKRVKDFFPYLSAVWFCHWFLFPMVFFFILSVFTLSLFNPREMMALGHSPALQTFSAIQNTSLLTYLIFFTVLGVLVKYHRLTPPTPGGSPTSEY